MKRLLGWLDSLVHWCCKWPGGELLAGLVACCLLGVFIGLCMAFPIVPGLFGLWAVYDGLLKPKGKPEGGPDAG